MQKIAADDRDRDTRYNHDDLLFLIGSESCIQIARALGREEA
jgi:hypothetical protein